MAKLPDLETWAKEAGERGAQYALKYLEEEYGVSPQRLIELAQADQEGRCVVLPRLEPGRGDPAGELGEPGPPGVPWSPGRHKTYNELIKWLRTASGSPGGVKMSNAAADALARLQAENEKLRAENEKLKAYMNDAYGTMYNIYGAGGAYCDAKISDFWQRWHSQKEG